MLKQLISRLIGFAKAPATVESVRGLLSARKLDQAERAINFLDTRNDQDSLIRLCLIAELAYLRLDDTRAEAHYLEALKSDPGLAEAHHGLSLIMFERQDVPSSLRHAQFACAKSPGEARYLSQLALCHIQLGNFSIAETPLRNAIKLDGRSAANWNNLGIVLRAKADHLGADRAFSKALECDPKFQRAADNRLMLNREFPQLENSDRHPLSENLSTASASSVSQSWSAQWADIEILISNGDTRRAIAEAERLHAQHPDDSALVCQIDRLFRRAGDALSGIELLKEFLLNHPDDAQCQAALGAAFLELGEPQSAEWHLNAAVAAGAADANILAQLGAALHQQERFADGLAVIEKAWTINPTMVITSQLASACVMCCHYERALELFDQLKKLGAPPELISSGGYATSLMYTGRTDQALNELNQLIQAQPHDPNLRFCRSQLYLTLGQYAKGWDDYDYRGLSYTKNFRVLPITKWDGLQALVGKRIVVLAEQGLGDQVMFASCLEDLRRLGPEKIVLEALDRIAPTLARSFQWAQVVPTRQNRDLTWLSGLGPIDYYVPLGDLPRYFRRSVNQFPGTPYLVADPQRVSFWRNQLTQLGPGPYIGISWRGGSEVTRSVIRTLDIEQLTPLSTVQAATWVCVQYGDVTQALSKAHEAGWSLGYWPCAIADLDEFSALMGALDAVLTVCNTTVHYAGALGVKTWVMAPKIPEWRYGSNRSDMPWYNSVKILRQSHSGEWAPVVEAAQQELLTLLDAK